MRSELIPPKIDFERRSQSPAAWVSTGMSVYLAAHTLFQHLNPTLEQLERGDPYDGDKHELFLRYRGPCALLAGLAIENFLKATILQRSPPSKRQIRTTRDLVKLSRDAKTAWSPEQTELLERLTRFVRWAGRYSVALSDEETNLPRFFVSADYREIVAIATHLLQLHQKSRDGFLG